MHFLTEEQYKQFIVDFHYYIKELQMSGWYIQIDRMDLSNTDDEAMVKIDCRERQLDVIISTVWENEITRESINEAARHEALEALLLPLEVVREHTSSPYIRDSIRHEIIVKLSNYIKIKEANNDK